jgi:hypothetical protein
VIGGVEPAGICGSGSWMPSPSSSGQGCSTSRAGSCPRRRGRDRAGASLRFVARPDGERLFVLHWKGAEGDLEHAVYLSQRDVRELQFAKASIATGWRISEELGIDESEIQQVLLAGSFGSHSPARARSDRARADAALPRIVPAGNVAGGGREDGAAVDAGTPRGDGDARRGRVRRAVRP